MIEIEDDFPHYHGDAIQALFMTNGLIMLIGLPFFSAYLQFTLFAAILGILLVGIFAGLTNHRNRVVMFLNIIVSLIGLFAFELSAIQSRDLQMYFLFNQVIAVIFFITTYLSIKSFREIYWTIK